jgi:two-component system, LytTR family, response regulator
MSKSSYFCNHYKIHMSGRIRTVLIDDEHFALDTLSKLIEFYCPELRVIGTANDISSAFELLTQQQPELVFLDIHLAQENSFDLLKQFNTIPFEIIFTSAHSDYGVSAFKVNAIDYLLKPIWNDDLEAAVAKVIQKKALLQAGKGEELSIPVHINDTVEYIRPSAISSLVANDNYTDILTLNGRKLTVSKTLATIETILAPTDQFVRIHRSVVINTQHVAGYSKTTPCFVKLSNGSCYEVSRRKKHEILAQLKATEI